ncbi:hypothetical protein [Lentzea flaviverrucosa]|uniref:Uncharacterized protein n=1 Tax=Lentzea flaviverrucosa TaxID=200379 RepID=A0A1H9TMM5_9PSEU|nr:hypothetical protein [Lentzea flaviverrucosa]RDI33568.1 hypothetical protein DFR72_102823 [Lentzea flaviverrucosa]SER97853.1 hypothetical protein SAMN05216195_10834 [Lentzea flaviverrucosa]
MDELPGKHRLDDGPQPLYARPVAGGDRIPLPRRRQIDPLQDTDGLRKFNIGLVPASVTPPRTWKRAAWFAVVSSVLVLVGLSVAAAKLVGGGGEVETVGLPGYPSDVPTIAALPTGGTSPSATGRSTPSAAPTGKVAPAPGTGASSVPRTSGQASAANPQPSGTAPPVITTVPVSQAPVVDGGKIAEQTEHFYKTMATNADTALAMTTDTVRSNADALLEGRVADISLIEVKEILVDPSKGLTVSLLQVTKKDGSVSTEKRELTFTVGDLPLINGERLKLGG